MDDLRWLMRGRKPRSARRFRPLVERFAPAAVMAAVSLAATVGWLWGQSVWLQREKIASRQEDRERRRKELAGEAFLQEIRQKTRSTQEVLARQEEKITELRAMLRRDAAQLSIRMITPTVRIELEESVGSGTVIHVKRGKDRSEAYLLTAYHVIEEAKDEKGGFADIPVEFFTAQGDRDRKAVGTVRLCAQEKDLALLVVQMEGVPPACARLATPRFLKGIRTFDPVYTVGCPLGLAPLPSKGEVTHKNRQVGGQTFWMTNAQMIFGNSGGGVYDAATQRMIGVSSRVCAYGRIMPSAVPHLGLMVPMETVHEWFAANGLAYLSEDPRGEE